MQETFIKHFRNVTEMEVVIRVGTISLRSTDFDMTMHASCTVVSTGGGIAQQMLYAYFPPCSIMCCHELESYNQVQLSVLNYLIFTDFLFVVNV